MPTNISSTLFLIYHLVFIICSSFITNFDSICWRPRGDILANNTPTKNKTLYDQSAVLND